MNTSDKYNEYSERLTYKSKKMSAIVNLALKIAKQDVTVLIQGESGTGKEVIANMIYENSRRFEKPFVKINCGAIPGSLLESELFGYEAGAFTGADENGKAGLLEIADGGTLFLDEVGGLTLNLQVKLLGALQEKKILRVGGKEYIPVDIRIIAATNVNLKNAMKEGKFREDLYYRLNVVPIIIPPLRERKEDIMPLVNMFLNQFNQKYNTRTVMAEDARKLIRKYRWPGNVRELENVVERLVITVEADEIRGIHLAGIPAGPGDESGYIERLETDLKTKVEAFEKNLIIAQMEYYKNSRELANALGINKSTLTRKMKKYQIKSIYSR